MAITQSPSFACLFSDALTEQNEFQRSENVCHGVRRFSMKHVSRDSCVNASLNKISVGFVLPSLPFDIFNKHCYFQYAVSCYFHSLSDRDLSYFLYTFSRNYEHVVTSILKQVIDTENFSPEINRCRTILAKVSRSTVDNERRVDRSRQISVRVNYADSNVRRSRNS